MLLDAANAYIAGQGSGPLVDMITPRPSIDFALASLNRAGVRSSSSDIRHDELAADAVVRAASAASAAECAAVLTAIASRSTEYRAVLDADPGAGLVELTNLTARIAAAAAYARCGFVLDVVCARSDALRAPSRTELTWLELVTGRFLSAFND